MKDIFKDYVLQREELLARIAQELQLDKTRLERMETAYNAVAELLKKDDHFFDDLMIEIYAQGSKRIGTTVKPINEEDFDLDTVLHIYDPYHRHTPEEIYSALVNALEKDGYYRSIMEKKNRCVRLNYKSDFHMDILPACMPNSFEREIIKIPEKGLKNWSTANPKGFSNWFLNSANTVAEPLLKRNLEVLMKAQVETEQLPEEVYLKTPLQRATQLLKRYRDIYFQGKEYGVSSIVLTTLLGQLYRAENSIFETIDNIVKRIKDNYIDAINGGYRFKVFNPMNPEEEFTDSWTSKHYDAFYSFMVDFHGKWQNLKYSFETSKEDYIKLFGEGVYKKALNGQIVAFSKASNDAFAKASSLITIGAAFTDAQGNINSKEGVKNESHHNFGGKY
ncbi:nucleotidyltransferase domain-containing protein [Chryseobacterium taklimakanense]|uniref:Nucleotidyltransferase n=1 Tax=Chryseobacterium taklimakanense TaxID=536441 RepID=A0A3G8WHE7_9FLAO|nr:nucleotidyltransferase [Chryseobacterium taklimakanense]AZI20602.1 nucleotidyltransferase [Chryseobacterium taklimakanense]